MSDTLYEALSEKIEGLSLKIEAYNDMLSELRSRVEGLEGITNGMKTTLLEQVKQQVGLHTPMGPPTSPVPSVESLSNTMKQLEESINRLQTYKEKPLFDKDDIDA